MSSRRRLGKKLVKSFLPILLVLVAALVASLAFIVHGITRPPKQAYLVTPQAFSQISGPVLKITDESWTNRDGTHARGWLLKGSEGAPAVILLHRYGGDRSWLFNLGVKINETTNSTILWPDLRGHGINPPVKWTSFGTSESYDLIDALTFLRTLKSENKGKLIGDHVGFYGVELGAYTALKAATSDSQVKVLVLDSVPRTANELVQAAVARDIGVDNRLLRYLSSSATRIYFLGAFDDADSCQLAASLRDQHVLLLSGAEAGHLRDTTASLERCFPNKANVEIRTDLPLTGMALPSATGEQGEAYDRIVIDFFDKYLR
jgi:pimeloyl-ACP methyl ester carboxylesterase